VYIAFLSVRPFVCPSHAGIVSKRINVGWSGDHWRVAECI